MKINNLILSTFLAITAILFNSCGNSSVDSASKERGDYVTIGNQVWTRKNLDVATYRNGDVIPHAQSRYEFETAHGGAWCYYRYYKKDASNGPKKGKLYNWAAVNDPRGLAPKGYHIPTDREWRNLIDYLGGESESTKMKSTNGWSKGWSGNGNGTNISGFSGLPGGFRQDDGWFQSVGYIGRWWSSTVHLYSSAYYLEVNAHDGIISRPSGNMRQMFSVRCLRD